MSKIENCEFKNSGKVDIEQSLSESKLSDLLSAEIADLRMIASDIRHELITGNYAIDEWSSVAINLKSLMARFDKILGR